MDAIVKYPNRWTAGISGNPNGRPVGSRTAFSNAFLRDLAESWAEHGKATMVHTAKANPEVYFATCARLIPKDVQLTIEQTTPQAWIKVISLPCCCGAFARRSAAIALPASIARWCTKRPNASPVKRFLNLDPSLLHWRFIRSFCNKRNAGDGRRCKNAAALLLQVTTDLPNPAEYESDRHRDCDFENHDQEHQNHRRVSLCSPERPRPVFWERGPGAWACVRD